MILRLVVLREDALLLIDRFTHESALVLRAHDLVSDALNLDLFLVDGSLGVHDVAIGLAALVAKVSIGPLHVL